MIVTAREARPRGLQLLFIVLIITGMILIAIGFVSLIAAMPHSAAPDACTVLPPAGISLPA